MDPKHDRRLLIKLWESNTRQTAFTQQELLEAVYPNGTEKENGLSAELGHLAEEGYIKLLNDPDDQASTEVEVTAQGLRKIGTAYEDLEDLGFVPQLEQQRILLSVLRQRRMEDITKGQWRTTLDLRRLSETVGLPPERIAELLHILLREEYVDGSLDIAGTPGVRVAGLTRKGLAAIGKMPIPDEKALLIPYQPLMPNSPQRAKITGPGTRQEAQAPAPTVVILKDETSPKPPTENGEKPAAGDKDERNAVEKTVEKAADKASSAIEAISPIIQALSGFVTILVALAYPVGLIALWIQLSGELEYGFWRSLYAASLATVPMVVGNMVFVLAGALLTFLVPMWVWYAYTWVRTREGAEVEGDSTDHPRLKTAVYASLLGYPLLVVLVIRYYPTSAFVEGLFESHHRWDVWLWVSFSVFTVAGLVSGGLLFRRAISQYDQFQTYEKRRRAQHLESQQLEDQPRGADEEYRPEEPKETSARWSRYGGIAVVYACSIFAGLCIAGLQDAALPNVVMTFQSSPEQSKSQQQAQSEQRAQSEERFLTLLAPENVSRKKGNPPALSTHQFMLLGNRGSYWYIVCGKGSKQFMAIPDSKVTEVTRVVEPENQKTMACPSKEQLATTDPDDPEPKNNRDLNDPEPRNNRDLNDPEPKNNPDPDDPEPKNDSDPNDPEPRNEPEPNNPIPSAAQCAPTFEPNPGHSRSVVAFRKKTHSPHVKQRFRAKAHPPDVSRIVTTPPPTNCCTHVSASVRSRSYPQKTIRARTQVTYPTRVRTPLIARRQITAHRTEHI